MNKLFLLTISIFFWTTFYAQAPEIEWQKSFGGSGVDRAHSVRQTTDGGYIVAGFSNSNDGDVTGNHGADDYWIIKLSHTGEMEWQKSYGGSYSDIAYSIQQTSDGGYIVVGISKSDDGDVIENYGYYDVWVLKLNSTGYIEWQKCYGGSHDDVAYSIQQTIDGGYIFAGGSSSNDVDVTENQGVLDFWIVKLNSAGNMEWQKSYGGSENDFAQSIQQTADGGFIAAGRSSSNDGDVTGNHGSDDYWIIKLNISGNMEWQKSFGGSGSDVANSIQQTTDGGYIVGRGKKFL